MPSKNRSYVFSLLEALAVVQGVQECIAASFPGKSSLMHTDRYKITLACVAIHISYLLGVPIFVVKLQFFNSSDRNSENYHREDGKKKMQSFWKAVGFNSCSGILYMICMHRYVQRRSLHTLLLLL